MKRVVVLLLGALLAPHSNAVDSHCVTQIKSARLELAKADAAGVQRSAQLSGSSMDLLLVAQGTMAGQGIETDGT